MEGNIPSLRYIARQGFKQHRTLVMPAVMLYKKMDITGGEVVRPMVPGDLDAVAGIVNKTWQDYELYEPMTADSLARLVTRTPAYSYDNIFVMEEGGQIRACLGFWDWSQVMRLMVKALSMKMRAMGYFLDIVRVFRPIPRGPKTGDILKQIALTPIGFREREHMIALLKHVNNWAFLNGIQQMFCLCEKTHPLMSCLKGFMHIDTAMHINVKPLSDDVSLADRPVFINGLDL